MNNKIKFSFLFVKIYKISPSFFRKLIIKVLRKLEGGFFWSNTIRDIYKIIHKIEIGKGTYGCFDTRRFPEGTKFGNYCSIANDVRYFNANHPLSWASTHPIFYNPNLKFVSKERINRNCLKVGHDVWIGYGVTILSNCKKIGNGAIIAAKSVVTKDVLPYTIVGGVPAKVIKKRFNDQEIELLEKSRWYYMKPEVLIEAVELVDNPKKFAEYILKNNSDGK